MDGEKHRIIKSDTEFGVVYRTSGDAAAAARRLAAKGLGVLAEDKSGSNSRVKLLRVLDASTERRRLIEQDPAVVSVHPVYRYAGVDAPVISSGTINVKLRAGLGAGEIGPLWGEYHLVVVTKIRGLHDVYVVAPSTPGEDEVLRAAALAGDRRIAWAQPNFRTPTRMKQLADDEFFDRQWHLNNSGQTGGTADADIDAVEAWSISTGEGVLIGMFDSACDVDHEDLRDNYIGIGQDPTVKPGAPGADDPRPKNSADSSLVENRHGTAVMGLAAASGNSLGVRGVAYGAQFTASRGLESIPLESLTDSETASVYFFALEQGVDVHINSWGYPTNVPIPAVVEDALETAFKDGRDLDGPSGDGSTNRPPRGMVIVFAAGNDAEELFAGGEISTLPTVIGVGASDMFDRLAIFSNYGRETDVLAPGIDTPTTDNDDAAGYFDDGYNIGGVIFDDFGNAFEDLDSAGLYTGFFGGTSAACPIAAGVAALVLSVNPLLTATDVRLILEHTTDRISTSDANYNNVTRRSLRYAYGRINARRAVEAAEASLAIDNRTWPERVANVTVVPGELRWIQNGDPLEFLTEAENSEVQNDFVSGTDEFLVLESDSPLSGFTIEDGRCYDVGQVNCAPPVTLTPLPDGVNVAAVGCALACGEDVTTCEAGAQQCMAFSTTAGQRYFAIYARSSTGRYSFGVSADSVGNVAGRGQLPPGASAIAVDGGGVPVAPPQVTISVSPLQGTSPLTVQVSGNAVSALEIEANLTLWDFGDGTSPVFARTTTHTYIVPDGESETFIARLTMFDVAGNQGSAQTAITVAGQATAGTGTSGSTGTMRIKIGVPGTVGSDVERGISPFQVELSLEATTPTPSDATLQSVFWDLGDGTTASSLTVTHTYVNTSDDEMRLPITATATSLTAGGVTLTSAAARRITILPGTDIPENPDVVLPGTTPIGNGGAASTTCSSGMIPLVFTAIFMTFLRRRRG